MALRRENQRLRQTAGEAVVERAKGALMLRYGIDADRAYGVLVGWSQDCNVDVHIVAGTLVNVVCSGAQQVQTVEPTLVSSPTRTYQAHQSLLLLRRPDTALLPEGEVQIRKVVPLNMRVAEAIARRYVRLGRTVAVSQHVVGGAPSVTPGPWTGEENGGG